MLGEAEFRDVVFEMILRAETTIPRDAMLALRQALKRERGVIPRLQLRMMLKNLELARKSAAPICQDTGTFTFFVRLGRNLRLTFDLQKAISEAVTRATSEVPLRVNLVDPLTRERIESNTGRAQPAVHMELVEGEDLRVDLLIKGGGTENCGRLFMMSPIAGLPEIKQNVIGVLKEAGGKPCPPTIVGVGIGGSTETAPLLAKMALLRPINRKNADRGLARLEREIELTANGLGIGPMGLGGRTTVLRALVEKAPCHTASLPVAVALQCWPARRARAKMVGNRLEVVEP
jgi:fumarate hydratase subunit alpha